MGQPTPQPRRAVMVCCSHCPRPADIHCGDDDGPRPMCLSCFSAFLLGVVRHDITTTMLVTTPATPALLAVTA